jgi:hypothetical protein
MIPLLLGLATLGVMMGALGMFSRAQVATIKAFGVWVLAIGGLAMAGLLLLTGRAAVAVGLLAVLGPTVWAWMRPPHAGLGAGARRADPGTRGQPGDRAGGHTGRQTGGRAPGGATGGMSREEALQVLGLRPGVNQTEIQAAYVRLMRAAHPDGGGSDWLAARINQARDTLLG